MRVTNKDRIRLWRITSVLGFLSLLGAVSIAQHTPVDGYELSIYTGAHSIIWVGFGLAVCAAVGLCIGSNDRSTQSLGAGLIFLTVVSFTSLPIIRGYHFYASSDTFAHLGWVRDIVAGYRIPKFILYPGSHIIMAKTSLVTGLSPSQSVMLFVPVFAALFCVCVEATARRVLSTQHNRGVGLIVGAVMMPIMTVQLPNLQMTPLTLAVFFVAFILLVLTLYHLNTSDWRMAMIMLLPLPALVLLHPLVAVAIASFLGGIAIVRYISIEKGFGVSSPKPFRLIAGAGAILSMITYIQLSGKPTFQGSISSILLQILDGISTTGGTAARTDGLSKIGVSIWEILIKIFTPKIIITALAGISVARSLRDKFTLNRCRSTDIILSYAFALFPIGMLTAVVFAAGRFNLVTRFVGVAFVILSVLAAVEVCTVINNNRMSRPLIIGLYLVLVVAVVTAGPALFISPYLYQDSPHVTEAERSGYATLFEYRADSAVIGSTRSPVPRHRTAYLGQRIARGKEDRQPNSKVLANIKNERPEPFFFPYHFNTSNPVPNTNQTTYLVLPSSDIIIDTELYNGLRYTSSDYDRIKYNVSNGKVYSNGGFHTYIT